jgi:hypothetical protein
MGAKSNASTTGKMAQDSKPMTFLEWRRICLLLFLEIPLRLDEPVFLWKLATSIK